MEWQDQNADANASVPDLMSQGKSLYRTSRFKLALTKFESALKQEPENDEALGWAAMTAFRLDSQAQSREYFLRRVELPKQKDSVKVYCYYQVALTYWREAHDIVARSGAIEDGRVVYRLPEQVASEINGGIEQGLVYVDRALALTGNYAEAYNMRNLLHAEAALLKAGGEKAKEHQRLAVEALKRAIEITEVSGEGKRGDVADFNQPTVRVSEFARTKEEEEKLDDQMMKLIEGGKPIKRVSPIFPSARVQKPSSDQNDPAQKGAASATPATPATSGGDAAGQGIVKVEVLISTAGEVVFARVVDGRPEFNGAAVFAARGWKFEPAKFEGKPVQVSGVITFEAKPGKGR